ncbi:AEC family transporter [Yanghanlia caeni]|uniref:AEC family transporter n=1 Tax=Yanghanlia caeni TaxID=3064283 RepID=A0ABU1D6P8_9BURK|nr:AEC family transporter [Alcaligenaceae bacterium LG-2]HZH56601.1 AEC family transporter [Burkholderiaceae bacterium]
MSLILEAVLPLFALILAGYVAGRRRILGAAATDSLNTFVVWMALPALLFQAMALISWSEIRQPGFIAASALAMAAVFGASFLADRREGRRLADASLSSLAAAYGNAGYMGIPLCIMVLGEASLPAVIIITLLTACILFAFSIVLIELDLKRGASLGGTLRKVGISVLRNPLVCSPLAGLVVSGVGITLPAPVLQFTNLLGAAASPCALVTIGLFLSQGSTTGHRHTVWRIVSLKLLAHPLLAFVLVTWVFEMPPMWAAAAVLLAALPVGTGPFMVAKLYDREAAVTSEATLLSTVLSVFTVSLLVGWIAP